MLPDFLERLEAIEDVEASYAIYLENSYDAELGWLPRPGSARPGTACDDTLIEYRYDSAAARVTPTQFAGPEILAFGDSYTHGDGAVDADTYPWQLSQLLERPVVNYGVGGFGPLQAALRLERVAGDHPDAEIAVLGVMSENSYRVVNAYRPVYHYPTRGLFAFKPSMRGGRLRSNPNAPPAATLQELLPRVRAGFADDFFSLPEAEFPYLLALARGVRSPAVQLTLARRRDPLAAWHTPKLRDALRATLDRFISTSEAHGFAPLIVWIPQAAYLRHALREVSLELETAFVGRAAFVAVAGSGHDWARFAESGCHPGREGYGIIARHVAAALRGL